jgi:prevent-host-death family protein
MGLANTFPKISATEAGAHFGRALNQAQRGPVTIQRRGESFVLIRSEDYERQLAEGAAGQYPRLSLDQLLAGYDQASHRANWPDDAPTGKESL